MKLLLGWWRVPRSKKGSTGAFQRAVRATPVVADALQPGLQALGANSVYVENGSQALGSVNIEVAVGDLPEGETPWDYLVGAPGNDGEVAHWIEIHPASSTGNVSEVLKKHTWLMHWLAESAQSLKALPPRFVWIATGSVTLTPRSSGRRRVALAGIEFRGRRYPL